MTEMTLEHATTTVRASGADWLVTISVANADDGQAIALTLRIPRRDQTVPELQRQAIGLARALLGAMLV